MPESCVEYLRLPDKPELISADKPDLTSADKPDLTSADKPDLTSSFISSLRRSIKRKSGGSFRQQLFVKCSRLFIEHPQYCWNDYRCLYWSAGTHCGCQCGCDRLPSQWNDLLCALDKQDHWKHLVSLSAWLIRIDIDFSSQYQRRVQSGVLS